MPRWLLVGQEGSLQPLHAGRHFRMGSVISFPALFGLKLRCDTTLPPDAIELIGPRDRVRITNIRLTEECPEGPRCPRNLLAVVQTGLQQNAAGVVHANFRSRHQCTVCWIPGDQHCSQCTRC